MNINYPRYSSHLFWLILAIGFLVRIIGVMYGLPQLLDPDENIFVNAASRMLSSHSFDPHWYGAPASTIILLLAISYKAIEVFGLFFGIFDSFNDFNNLWFNDVTIFYFTGRIITVVSGTFCIIATYKLAKYFVTKPFALTAAAIVAFAPSMVFYSSIIRMDMLQILFILLVAIYSVKIIENPRESNQNFAIAGLFLGLAVTSKYPGVIAVIAILIAAALSNELNIKEKIIAISIAAFSSLVSSFISGPYLFLNFHGMLHDVLLEARSSHLSATSPGFLMGLWEYLTIALRSSSNIFVVVLGCVGLLIMSFRIGKALIVSSLFLAYLVFISSLNLWWIRWALPLIPLIAIGFSVALQKIYSTLRGYDSWKKIAIFSVAAAIISPLLLSSMNAAFKRFENNDTRVKSLEWVYNNIPKNSKILLENYAPQLSLDDYDLFKAKSGKIISLRDSESYSRPYASYWNLGSGLNGLDKEELENILAKSGVQYIIMSNFKERFKREEKLYQAELKVYETIINSSKEVRIFKQDKDSLGNTVYIYSLQ